MEFVVKIELDRTEGRNVSRDLVEEALHAELENLQIDAEDTQYETITIVGMDSPKEASAGSRIIKQHAREIAALWKARGSEVVAMRFSDDDIKEIEIPRRPANELERAVEAMVSDSRCRLT